MLTINLRKSAPRFNGSPTHPPLNTIWNPRAQRTYALALSSASARNKLRSITCWSEIFVNTLGEMIERKLLSKDDIEIKIDGSEEVYKFNDNGVLEDGFPFGWFSPTFDYELE